MVGEYSYRHSTLSKRVSLNCIEPLKDTGQNNLSLCKSQVIGYMMRLSGTVLLAWQVNVPAAPAGQVEVPFNLADHQIASLSVHR